MWLLIFRIGMVIGFPVREIRIHMGTEILKESGFTTLKCPFKALEWFHEGKKIEEFRWDCYMYGDDMLRLYVHFPTVGEYECHIRSRLVVTNVSTYIEHQKGVGAVYTEDYMSDQLLNEHYEEKYREYMPYDIQLRTDTTEFSIYEIKHAGIRLDYAGRLVYLTKHKMKVGLRMRDHIRGLINDTVFSGNSFKTLPYTYESGNRLESIQSAEFYFPSSPEKTTGPIFFHHASPTYSTLKLVPRPELFVSTITSSSFVVYLVCPDDVTIADEEIHRYKISLFRTYEEGSQLKLSKPPAKILHDYLSNAKFVYNEKGRRMIVHPFDSLSSSETYALEATYQNKRDHYSHDTLIFVKTLHQNQGMKSVPSVKELKVLEVEPRRIRIEFTRMRTLEKASITLSCNGKAIYVMENVASSKVNFTNLEPGSWCTIRVAPPQELPGGYVSVTVTLKTPKEKPIAKNTQETQERKNRYERRLKKKAEPLERRIAELDKQIEMYKEKLRIGNQSLKPEQIADINKRSRAVKEKELKLASRSEFMSRRTARSVLLSLLVVQFSVVVGLSVFVALQFCFLHSMRE